MLALPQSSPYYRRRQRVPVSVLVMRSLGALLFSFCMVQLLRYAMAHSWKRQLGATRDLFDIEDVPLEAGIEEYPDLRTELQHIQETDNPQCHMLYGRCLPQFFVIGAFKAGTTSMYKWLSMHPNVRVSIDDAQEADIQNDRLAKHTDGIAYIGGKAGPIQPLSVVRIKETGFFNNIPTPEMMEIEYERKLERIKQEKMRARAPPQVAPNGLVLKPPKPEEQEEAQSIAPGPYQGRMATYRRYFSIFPYILPEDHVITGEATPAYLPSPKAPCTMAFHLPWAKPIALLREPVYRSYSRMSHMIDMQCARNPAGHLCNAEVQPKIFTFLVDMLFPGVENCLTSYWADTYEVVNAWSSVDMEIRFRQLSDCMVQSSIAQTNRLVETIPDANSRTAQLMRMGQQQRAAALVGHGKQQLQQQERPGPIGGVKGTPGGASGLRLRRPPTGRGDQTTKQVLRMQQQRQKSNNDNVANNMGNNVPFNPPRRRRVRRLPGSSGEGVVAPHHHRGLVNVNRVESMLRGPAGKGRVAEPGAPNPVFESELLEKANAIAISGGNFIRQSLRRSILWHSIYAPQLTLWKKYFPELLVIKAEDLYSNSADSMAAVARYLDLPEIDWTSIVQSKYNVGFDKGPLGKIQQQGGAGFVKEEAKQSIHVLEPATKLRLQQLFDPYNKQISRILNEEDTKRKSWWPYK